MMRMPGIFLVAGLILAMVASSCAGAPPPAPPLAEDPSSPEELPPAAEAPLPEAPPAVVEAPAVAFDPATVSAAVKEAALQDVKALILELNRIIQRKNYDAWLLNLTEEYISTYSDAAVLAKLSEAAVLKRGNIVLGSLRDYFLYVVYPSHQSDKVDDVVFVGDHQIKAITISPKGERLILYNLEKMGDTWKIGIGR